jgi:hypothetical protein
MNETKFTPGPWKWTDSYKSDDGRDTWSLLGNEGYGILSCDGEGNSPQNVNNADAHLIAAAPDMYEAMQEFCDRVDRGEVRSKYTYGKFKEVLRKARGEE